jgi:leucyl/phenylalanyl-tRNA--protein transferase
MTNITSNQTSNNRLYWVADNVISDTFPPVESALRDPDGLLAIGGDLTADRLLDAYRRGIFPWYSEGQPVLWWSPDPRCVLHPAEIHISKSLAKTLRRDTFKVTFNKAFPDVINNCAAPRNGNTDTWITKEIINSYTELASRGHIISVETWCQDELVGGLYGVVIGKVYFGESMFSRVSDASKIALVQLCHELNKRKFRLIDCQIYSKHLNSLGAKPMPRNLFVNILNHYCHIHDKFEWPEIHRLT